jgi:hypothetical protein
MKKHLLSLCVLTAVFSNSAFGQGYSNSQFSVGPDPYASNSASTSFRVQKPGSGVDSATSQSAPAAQPVQAEETVSKKKSLFSRLRNKKENAPVAAKSESAN